MTSSLLLVPISTSQNSEEIKTKLRGLEEEVSLLPLGEAFHKNMHAAQGQKNALTNKIEAVIHQIEAGAYKGAVNKLENDLKDTIETWITEDYAVSLIEKINEIIKLITGELPPPPLPDFSVTALPTELEIALGKSGTSIMTITSLNGFNQSIDLTVYGVPTGVTATLDPEQVTPPVNDTASSTLTVMVDASATTGTYELTVTGTSNMLQRSAAIALEITEVPPPPDFSVETNPSSLTIVQGESATSTITITSFHGFDESVDLTVSGEPTGATATLDPTQATPPANGLITSVLSISVAEAATPATYELTLTGTSNSLEHSATLSLEITMVPVPPDTEAPTIRIEEPANGSFVTGLVNIRVFMHDENFKLAKLSINNTAVTSWTLGNVSTGEHLISWDTTLSEYPDDLYNITLSAEDSAGNRAETFVSVFVDNTGPTIETPTWTPEEPSVDLHVNVTVEVKDGQAGSGVRNVTLWYRNITVDDWQFIPMSFNVTTGNWTGMIPAHSEETAVEFYIEAFDNAGNKALTDAFAYNVVALVGIPLAWIAVIILLILSATIAVFYFLRRHSAEKQGAASGT
ncbi:MAG: Ig-like domain repeat protein [Candidatus Bathyarchaeota archaeon]|nr:MAG: Ig-like domain repeat protein [Candidatus Bathyarchaeota archaeon]